MEEKDIYPDTVGKRWLLCFVGLVFIILSSSTAFGDVFRVPAGGYSTIQAGIDAASNGDTVTIADGTYVGLGNKDLDFNGKAITVKSDNGPENCVIDCEGIGRGFYFHSGETQTSIVSGFTIANGQADYGGGIRCSSSPKIINCRIISNTAGFSGGGIFCSVRLCTITNCIITANTATWGGGIYCSYAQPQITNCTISGNTATSMNGCGIHFNQSSPTITNCILWGDSPSEFSVNGIDSKPVVSYCDVESYEISSATIIHSDPLFLDVSDSSPLKWDLHLQSSSPCIDSGTSVGAPDYDIDGNPRPQGAGYDMGAYEAGSSIYVRYVSQDGVCGGKSPCYTSIQEAINATSTGSAIKIAQGTYDESLVLNESKVLTFQGGWDSTFTTQSSCTTVNSITISNGTVVVEKLVIQ